MVIVMASRKREDIDYVVSRIEELLPANSVVCVRGLQIHCVSGNPYSNSDGINIDSTRNALVE